MDHNKTNHNINIIPNPLTENPNNMPISSLSSPHSTYNSRNDREMDKNTNSSKHLNIHNSSAGVYHISSFILTTYNQINEPNFLIRNNIGLIVYTHPNDEITDPNQQEDHLLQQIRQNQAHGRNIIHQSKIKLVEFNWIADQEKFSSIVIKYKCEQIFSLHTQQLERSPKASRNILIISNGEQVRIQSTGICCFLLMLKYKWTLLKTLQYLSKKISYLDIPANYTRCFLIFDRSLNDQGLRQSSLKQQSLKITHSHGINECQQQDSIQSYNQNNKNIVNNLIKSQKPQVMKKQFQLQSHSQKQHGQLRSSQYKINSNFNIINKLKINKTENVKSRAITEIKQLQQKKGMNGSMRQFYQVGPGKSFKKNAGHILRDKIICRDEDIVLNSLPSDQQQKLVKKIHRHKKSNTQFIINQKGILSVRPKRKRNRQFTFTRSVTDQPYLSTLQQFERINKIYKQTQKQRLLLKQKQKQKQREKQKVLKTRKQLSRSKSRSKQKSKSIDILKQKEKQASQKMLYQHRQLTKQQIINEMQLISQIRIKIMRKNKQLEQRKQERLKQKEREQLLFANNKNINQIESQQHGNIYNKGNTKNNINNLLLLHYQNRVNGSMYKINRGLLESQLDKKLQAIENLYHHQL